MQQSSSLEGYVTSPVCTVLQGDDNFEEVQGSTMVVARTAHRDNKSDYYVDGRKSSFTAVTALLKGKGIDLDNNRFLILQVGLYSNFVPPFKSATW